MAKADWILDIKDVCIDYRTKRGKLRAVHNASLRVERGQSVAIIGESGCGKTTLATSIVQMLPLNARLSSGNILYRSAEGKETELTTLPEAQLRPLRWKEIVLLFQASQSSFNPVARIASQFIDTARAHGSHLSNEQILEKSRQLLKLVYLDGDSVLKAYPHEMSGGMKQRTLIALGLLLDPQLIILDEPTTALDLLTQKKILEILNSLRARLGFSMIFITHDLGIVTKLADRVVTMYAGSIVENASTAAFFSSPQHPYSRGLLKAIPKLTSSFEELFSIPGSTPDLVEKMEGCLFAPRCDYRMDICAKRVPLIEQVGEDRYVACHAVKEAVL